MSGDPLVKVVITSYNRRELLKAAVESVLAQTHQRLHIVIVDDASTDGAAELARQYEFAHPGRVTALLKPANRGVADSVRVGLQSAPEADYVAILNDDDRWLPEKLQRQLECFRSDPSLGLVFTEAQVCDEHDNLTGQLFSDIYGRFAVLDLEHALVGNHSCASTHLMTSQIAVTIARTVPDPCVVFDYYIVLVAAGLSRLSMVETPLAVFREAHTGLHNNVGLMERHTTIVRQCLFERNPTLTVAYGGPRAVRRRLGWLAFNAALYALLDGNWREWWWQSRRVFGQRSAKAIVWLCFYSLRTLPKALARSGAMD